MSTNLKHSRYPKLGHLWTSHKHHVRFLVQREEFHLLQRASQRSSLPKRLRFRVTHGTFSVLEPSGTWFLFLATVRERYIGSARPCFYPQPFAVEPAETVFSSQCSVYPFSHTMSKVETGEMSRKRKEYPCFQKQLITPMGQPERKYDQRF